MRPSAEVRCAENPSGLRTFGRQVHSESYEWHRSVPGRTARGGWRNFCAWATSPVVQGEHEVGLAIQYLSALFAAGCALGWEEGGPGDFRRPEQGIEAVRAKAAALPFRYYSEVFNNLVIPPEEPVVGDIVDDLVDIYSDIAPGLELFESGDSAAAKDHWQFWLSSHWGEHATSALRALWSFLAGRKGRE